MKNLILTGWFWHDFVCAAALALRNDKNADVLGMSKRKLPDFLNEVDGYKDITIIGVDCSANPELLKNALCRLKKKKVAVRWIGSVRMQEEIQREICSNIDIILNPDRTITATIADLYHCDYSDLEPLIEQKTAKKYQPYHELLEAAAYVYRNYQDESAYGRAIRYLAEKVPESIWSKTECELLDHFRRFGHRELVGNSIANRDLIARIDKIAKKERARVLIFGESGTGKETVAQQIHNRSPRNKEPYIAFNCASVTPNLLEARFFGYEKGAFTGATERKEGLFEQADGGTLFLDEIGEMPLEAQGTLLRVLAGGRFLRVGGCSEIKVDVRLICATNRDLAAMVREGKFREDLFHRLNVVQIRVPPLREHKSDIAQLADGYWLTHHQQHLQKEQIEDLMMYDYPGNVRELFNLLERASVLEENDFRKLIAEHKELTAALTIGKKEEPDVPDELDLVIRKHIQRVYNKYQNNLSKTAEALNVARNTVRKYLDF